MYKSSNDTKSNDVVWDNGKYIVVVRDALLCGGEQDVGLCCTWIIMIRFNDDDDC